MYLINHIYSEAVSSAVVKTGQGPEKGKTIITVRWFPLLHNRTEGPLILSLRGDEEQI